MSGDAASGLNQITDATAATPDHRYRRLTIGVVLVATVARVAYLLWGPMRLFPDEAYYWQWSRHLALSYSDAGPVTAYVIRLSTLIGGDRELAVRAGALAFGLGAALFGYLLARDIFGHERAGFAAVVLFTVTPLFAAGCVVMTYDTLQVFFWALTCWLLWRIVAGGASRLWYAVALSLGLGFLTKYTMLLLLPSLLGFLLASRPSRYWLLRPQPYGALLLLGLVCSPVFIWNAQHAGAALGHIGHQALGGGRGLHVSPHTFLRYLGEQAGVISPLLFLAVIAAVTTAGRRGFREKDEGLLFLFWMSVPTLAFFTLWSLGAKVNPNWPVAGYFTAFLAVAGMFHEVLLQVKSQDSRPKEGTAQGRFRVPSAECRAPSRPSFGSGSAWLRIIYLVAAVVVAFGLTVIGHDARLLDVVGIHSPARLDPLVRALGWRTLGRRIDRIRRESPGRYRFLLANDYGTASELAFYVSGHPPVSCTEPGVRASHQYALWPGPEDRAGQDALYVQEGEDEKAVRRLQELCGRVEAPEALPVYRRGEVVATFYIYRCHGYHP